MEALCECTFILLQTETKQEFSFLRKLCLKTYEVFFALAAKVVN